MTAITVAPVYVLRSYAWALLKANEPDTWDEEKYGGLVPIVPLNEEPELSEYPGPRIIYEFSNQETGSMYFRGRGSMTFAIRDHNYRRLTRTMNILQEALGRFDESARDVNDYSERLKAATGTDFDISFGHIRTSFAESGTPEEEEGGMMVGIVNVSHSYFVEYDINTRPPV